MRLPFAAGFIASLVLPPPEAQTVTTLSSQTTVAYSLAPQSTTALQQGVSVWLSAAASTNTAPTPPSKENIALLRSAFSEFYGLNRDLTKSEDLLSQAIAVWQNQAPDELAGLYRVRGDCYTLLADAPKAAADYTKAIELLQGPGGSAADPEELPSALLGRARALKSVMSSSEQAKAVAQDFKMGLQLTGRQDDWDTPEELLEDGIRRNPYAAWEWGAVLRKAGEWSQAATVHRQAADAFEDIGDKAHAVISSLDAGIDLAAAGSDAKAVVILKNAIAQTKGIENRDYTLLQRVISKEGEARMVLAAILWNQGERSEAEKSLGTACLRLDQLQDAAQKMAAVKKDPAQAPAPRLLFSIDDEPVLPLLDCSDFKKTSFLTQRLGWPENLQQKMIKLEKLQVN